MGSTARWWALGACVMALWGAVGTAPGRAQEPWRDINQAVFRGPGRQVLEDWMTRILPREKRAEIYKEYRYQAERLLAKYADPTTTLQVVVGYDAQRRQYIWATRRYGDPEYQGCYRNRRNQNCGGHVYGMLMLVKTYRMLDAYFPGDPVTRAFRTWLEQAIEHAFRFGLAYRSATGVWEVVGEGQPMGGHRRVTAAAIKKAPLKIYPAIAWSGGKRVENWDGDAARHDMMTIAGAAEALRDPTLRFNRTLVRLGIALLLEKYIDKALNGHLDHRRLVRDETAYGKLRIFQILLHLGYAYQALKDDAPTVAGRARGTAILIFDEMVRRGPQRFKGLSGRSYENWVSGWNPATWKQRFQDPFPNTSSLANHDSVWLWGVSLMGPALAQLYAILDRGDPRRTTAAMMLARTAEIFRRRWDMPYLTYDGKTPILDGEGKRMHNAAMIGGVFGDQLPYRVGDKVIRGFYEPRPALRNMPAMPPSMPGAGLLPEEYHHAQDTWSLEATSGRDFGELFRWFYRNAPDAKAVHLRFLGEMWCQRKYTSPYAPIVRYPEGHPKAGQPFCVDSRQVEAPCGPGTRQIQRESNTPGKSYTNGKWVSDFKGFNCLHRENDFGAATLMFFAGLGTGDAGYVDMAMYTLASHLRVASGPQPVARVKDVANPRHSRTGRRTKNTVRVGDLAGDPFSWGRRAWLLQILGVLDGWW